MVPRQHGDDAPSGFLAMTSLVRLHHLMTTAIDRRLRDEFDISLTDYQILKALQLSEGETSLMRSLAWDLMVHATTVTLSVERLARNELVERHAHPRDRRARLVTITDDGSRLADEATRSLSRIEFGLPGLSPSQARMLTATIARLRANAGDLDRSYGSAPTDLG